MLQSHVDTVMFRDVVERHGVTQVAALRWIVRHCLRNPAGSFSVHRLTADLRSQGLGAGRDAVDNLLEHLTDAFLPTSVPLATDSERVRNTNPRKLYPADPRLIRAFDASGRSNLGHALETVVQIEAARRGAELGYLKLGSGREVELQALDEAAALDGKARALVLVLTPDQAPLLGGRSEVLPAYEWLLDAPA